MALLSPGPGRVLLDATLGGGGFSAVWLEQGGHVIALDRDPAAVLSARERFAPRGHHFRAVRSDFARLGEVLDGFEVPVVDAICMDLGLSSDQLDDPTRGFAFRFDGPLDLRFDPSAGEPAWRRIEGADAAELEGWLREWGEVRAARVIARSLTARAAAGQLRTTQQARECVAAVLPRRMRPEPELARVFQALRILVNDELEQLDAALAQVATRLRPGGRFAAVSYHSLEDRRVKRLLLLESGTVEGIRHLPVPRARAARMRVLTRRAVQPAPAEVARNPRARSARLRAGERLP
jgi:16S rRNA (cytosine1402-N4)-methyltransferase